MRRVGRQLMALGALVGALDVCAIAMHLGLVGVPWLVNVALLKLGFIAAGGLMAAGAATVRVGRRREQRQLESGSRSSKRD